MPTLQQRLCATLPPMQIRRFPKVHFVMCKGDTWPELLTHSSRSRRFAENITLLVLTFIWLSHHHQAPSHTTAEELMLKLARAATGTARI